MIQRKLLKQIIPGFIPLLIFIAADEIWGEKIGLLVAIAVGLLSLVYFWVRDRKFDKFILFDTLLIVALGVVSILLDNDVFFKLKPALIGVLICVILAVSVFTPSNIMLNMTKRYMKGIAFNDTQFKQMQKSMKAMLWLFSVYTLLVFYSVWYMSNEAWAFISGGLFYILFGVYFGYEFLKNKLAQRKFNKEEWLPLVSGDGEITGKAPRSICHSNKELLHPVVHLHVINNKDELFLQKRPANKSIQPNKWDTAVGGHITFGEDIETSLRREAYEEIGIQNFKAELQERYVWNSDVESEYVFCFISRYNGAFKISPTELSGGRFWSRKEIEQNLNNNTFTPNFIHEYNTIIKKKLK